MTVYDLSDEQRQRFREFCTLYEINYEIEWSRETVTGVASFNAYQKTLAEIPLNPEELKLFKILFAQRAVNGGEIC
jgi:hypothetical protein